MTNLGIGSRVRHPEHGEGVIIQVKPDTYYVTFMTAGMRVIARSYDKFEIIEELEPDTDLVSLSEIEQMFTRLLRKFSDIQETVELAPKWKGGMVILKPGDTGLKPKEIPLDNFFGKVIMLRDRLRVLEQHINASKNLSDEEKINLQQYITRCYGSLTTFNVLFKYTTDYFVGEKGKE